jgi:hypothetical protein
MTSRVVRLPTLGDSTLMIECAMMTDEAFLENNIHASTPSAASNIRTIRYLNSIPGLKVATGS